MFDRQKAPGPAKARLNLIGYQEASVFAAKLQGAGEVVIIRYVHTLPLNGFDNKCGRLTGGKRRLQRPEVIERNLQTVRQQRTETIPEIIIAVQRECAVGEAVEGIRAIDQPGPSGSLAGKFYRRFDRFSTRIGKKDLLKKRRIAEQSFCQNASQRGNVHLHQIGKVGSKNGCEGLPEFWMITTDAKHAPTA
jgi:hypothetical protein